MFQAPRCQNDTCLNNGTCSQHATGYTCLCAPGWNGTHCNLTSDPCVATQCNPNGTDTCVHEGNDTYTCSCLSGWVGEHCNEDCSCQTQEDYGTCVCSSSALHIQHKNANFFWQFRHNVAAQIVRKRAAGSKCRLNLRAGLVFQDHWEIGEHATPAQLCFIPIVAVEGHGHSRALCECFRLLLQCLGFPTIAPVATWQTGTTRASLTGITQTQVGLGFHSARNSWGNAFRSTRRTSVKRALFAMCS